MSLRLPLLRRSRRYLLRDLFSTARAAGSVNGTPAEPGPGTRGVTDTNSKLSIAGGVLSFATGGAAAGDPIYWLDSQARVLGRAVLMTVTPTTARIYAGWHDDHTSTPVNAHTLLFRAATSALNAYGEGEINVGVFTPGTAYQIAIALRAIGAFYFIRGGAFANWTLVWIGSSVSQSPQFPHAMVGDTTTVATADNLRVPARLFIPAPLASDSLAGDAGPLAAHATDGLGHAEQNGGGGLTWVDPESAWALDGAGAAVSTPEQGAEAVTNGTFDSDISGWSQNGLETFEWSAGTLHIVETGTSFSSAYQPGIFIIGQWYAVMADTVRLGAAVSLILQEGSNTQISARQNSGQFFNVYRSIVGGEIRFKINGGATEWTIDNVSAKPLTLASLFSSLQLSTPDPHGLWTLKALTAGTQLGFVARLDDPANPANFIIGYMDGTSVKLDACVAGVYTNLLTTAKAFTTGDQLVPHLDGANWRVYHVTAAGVATLLGSGTTAVLTGNYFGNFSTYEGNQIEKVEIWPTGSNGEWNGLNGM